MGGGVVALEERAFGEGGEHGVRAVGALGRGGGEVGAAAAREDGTEAFGVELDVAGTLEDAPEEGDAEGEGVDAVREGVAHVVRARGGDELVEGEEHGDVGVLFDGSDGGAGVAHALRAFEGEGQGGEDERGDAEGVEVLEDLARGAAARAAAEGGDDHDGAHAVEGGVEDGGRVLEGRARRGGLAARAAPREPVAAEEQEGDVAVSAGLRVRVDRERADAGAVGAEDAAEHGGAGAADAQKKKGRGEDVHFFF